MANIISIKVPNELKEKFQKNKYLLVTNSNLEEQVKIIEQLIEKDDVVGIARIIEAPAMNSPYLTVEKKGFYQEFIEWLQFALLQLMKSINIDISTQLQEVDMYASLCYCEEELAKSNDIIDNSILIDRAIHLVIEEKNGIDDNPQIRDICSLFINIGRGNIVPHELANISYEKFVYYNKNISVVPVGTDDIRIKI